MNKFELVKKEIEDTLHTSHLEEDPGHSKNTLNWVFKLKPDADESLQIAALGHDIERSITGSSEKQLKDFSKLKEFKEQHSIRSANIVSEMMEKHHYDAETIKKVKQLVERHEKGGDPESDILTDADSISFFDYNINFYFKAKGREKTLKKMQFMYERSSERAKKHINQIEFKNKEIEDLFKQAISEL